MTLDVSVLDGPSFRVMPRRSDRLVILFSGTNKSDGRFDFAGFADRTSASVILVNNGMDRWYQSGVPGLGDGVAETAEAMTRWATTLGAADVSLVGASMGGSGAVMYAALIGGRALAFSFEALIREPGSRSAAYMPDGFPLAHPDLRPLIRAARHPVTSILGGGDILDVVEAHRLRDLPNLRITLLRNVDHGVPRHLRRQGRLEAVLDAFVADETLPDFPEADDDLAVPGYADALTEAHLALLDGRTPEAIVATQRALDALPGSFAAHMAMGRALQKSRQPGPAIGHFGAAIALCPRDMDAPLYFAACLRRTRRHAHAIAFHRQTLAAWPHHHRVHFDLGLSYLEAGELEAARHAVAQAVRLAPRVPRYVERLAQIDARLNAPDVK